jgi:voltage-gated potassium channel
MKTRKQLKIAVALAIFLLTFGTAGFMVIDSYPLLDALYMTIITITTVGFAEIHPLSEAGRLFTIVLIFLGFLSLAWIARVLVEALVKHVLKNDLEKKKMLKTIDKLENHTIICGFGRVGRAAAEELHQANTDFLIIENNPTMCERIHEKGYLFIEGDATNEEILLKAGIKRASGIMALLPSDAENLFISLTARELNPTLQIIARAEDPSASRRVLRAGADRVVSPYVSAGKEVARTMLELTQAHFQTVTTSCTTLMPRWIEIQPGSDMEHKTIGEVASEMNRQILGFRRNGKDSIEPSPDIRLQAGDQIMVLDDSESEEETMILPRENQTTRVMIVDDNPVILKLYARLIKRAGLIPLIATNGKEALETIVRERPEAAVIDYMLPVLSGIEVCSRVRQTPGLEGMKIIIFTSDNHPETRERAIRAGADRVVYKSSDANELIQALLQMIQESDQEATTRINPSDNVSPKSLRRKSSVPSFREQTSYDPAVIIDRDKLLKNVDGDEALLREIVDIFLPDAERLLREIEQAIQERDASRLHRSAHTLKGSLANLGSKTAFELARQLDEHAKANDFSEIKDLYQNLLREMDFLKDYLLKRTATPISPM